MILNGLVNDFLFCLACLFVFSTSSPTFQVSGHRFSGSSVELLAKCGRRHDDGKAEGKWIKTVGLGGSGHVHKSRNHRHEKLGAQI